MPADEYNRKRALRACERRLQVETARSRHSHVADYASETDFARARQKIIRRRKGFHSVACAPQLAFEGAAHRGIVIDDEYRRLLVCVRGDGLFRRLYVAN